MLAVSLHTVRVWSAIILVSCFTRVVFGKLPLRYDAPLRNLDGFSPSPAHVPLAQSQQTIASDHSLNDDGKHRFDPDLYPLKRAVSVLQDTWFELWVGKWPTSIDWTGAVLNTHLSATLHTFSKAQNLTIVIGSPGINTYFVQSIAYYFGEDAFAIRNQAFDDMLWVVLSWLESVKFIRAHSDYHFESYAWHGSQFEAVFAHRSRVFYNLTTRGWSTDLCGGGMTWNPALEPYKNAITNQLFISASIGMYLDFPGDANDAPFVSSWQRHNQSHLRAAIDGYEWLKHSNMTNEAGLYVDGFHISGWNKSGIDNTTCDARNEMVYTYNQGVILSGLYGLWEATGNVSYLKDGHKLIRTTIDATGWDLSQQAKTGSHWSGLGRDGVMEEFCDAPGTCDQNGETFKGIYFHHLALFCHSLPLHERYPGISHPADSGLYTWHKRSCRSYIQWVGNNARAAESTRDHKGRMGTWWSAASGEPPSYAAIPIPAGAVDYRNNIDKLRSTRWTRRIDSGQHAEQQHRKILTREKNSMRDDDPNDRGRGRTVESHSGGVAVLRCLFELHNLD